MVLKISAIAIVLLATFAGSDCRRIRLDKGGEPLDVVDAQASKTGAISAAALAQASASALAQESAVDFAQEAVSHGPVFSSAVDGPVFSHGPVRKPLGVVHNPPSSTFSKTLDFVKRASPFHRRMILEAACDSSAFTCEEIIQFASLSSIGFFESDWNFVAVKWIVVVATFATGRDKKGCISDPANTESIVDSFKVKWIKSIINRSIVESSSINTESMVDRVNRSNTESIVESFGRRVPLVEISLFDVQLQLLEKLLKDLKPAKGVSQSPMHWQLQTGLRTDADMKKLLGEMKQLQLTQRFGNGAESYKAMAEEFKGWLKQIRANGEQFSGSQLVSLAHAIPETHAWMPPAEQEAAVIALLVYLEQYVTGVTCSEVTQILRVIGPTMGLHCVDVLAALKPNILDGQNKIAIVADLDQHIHKEEMVRAIRDVGVGIPTKNYLIIPPKNNPIFGVVRGDPVILVVDESTFMDARFTLGNDTYTRRKFCSMQLELVLCGLPKGTYFNVIRYSSSAVKTFQTPVPVNKTNINTAMEAVRWRGGYTPGQDPVGMLEDMKIFALGFKLPFKRSSRRNSMQALTLAYSMAAASPWATQARARYTVAPTTGSPQIYFLTSGKADGGARQILDKIDELDNGRNIPVNTIAFMVPADPETKQFVKDLADKTGGFFRSIEQPNEGSVDLGMQQSNEIPRLHSGQYQAYSSSFEVAPVACIAVFAVCLWFLGVFILR